MCTVCVMCVGDLKEVTTAVAEVEMSDHLVDVVITLFDEDSE